MDNWKKLNDLLIPNELRGRQSEYWERVTRNNNNNNNNDFRNETNEIVDIIAELDNEIIDHEQTQTYNINDIRMNLPL